MQFTIEPIAQPPAMLLKITGDLDISAARLLRETVTRSVEGQCRQVCLDLGQVTFVDAAGIQALARAQAEAAIRGARLEITEWSPAVERLAAWTDAFTTLRRTPPVDA